MPYELYTFIATTVSNEWTTECKCQDDAGAASFAEYCVRDFSRKEKMKIDILREKRLVDTLHFSAISKAQSAAEDPNRLSKMLAFFILLFMVISCIVAIWTTWGSFLALCFATLFVAAFFKADQSV